MFADRLLAVGLALGLAGACAPPPVTDGDANEGSTDTEPLPFDTGADAVPVDTSADTTRADSSPPNDVGGTGDTADAVEAPAFSEVKTIIVESCAKSNCHGTPPAAGQEFLLESNDPSKSKIESTLEGTTIDMPEAPLVEAGQPEQSGLYQAVVPLENRTEMPLGGELSDDKLETIRTWIEAGAPYE